MDKKQKYSILEYFGKNKENTFYNRLVTPTINQRISQPINIRIQI